MHMKQIKRDMQEIIKSLKAVKTALMKTDFQTFKRGSWLVIMKENTS